MNIIPSLLRPLAGHCLAAVSLCSALTHAEEPAVIGQVVPGFAPASNTICNGLAIQPDGKVLVGGSFNTLGGVPRTRLARLHPDGTADLSFNCAPDHRTEAFVLMDDGRILIGGLFSTINGTERRGIARLHADGSLDPTLDLSALNDDRRVDIIRLLKLRSGKILAAGNFTSLSGYPTMNIARLNADGSVDPTFSGQVEGTSQIATRIYAVAEQPDGKLLVGGHFTTVNGVPRFGFARLHEDGTLDTTLDLSLKPYPGTNYDNTWTRVASMLVQPDGKILIGGEFNSMLGQPRGRLARLNADGSLDATYSPMADNSVLSLALQADGNLLAAGVFTRIAGQTRLKVARLYPDGSLDPGFQSDVSGNFSGTISGLTLDRQGKVWITGEFETVGGLDARGITKLENHPANMELAMPNGSSLFWGSSRTAPALRDVEFQLSTDGGAAWTTLGAGTKVDGGWSIGGLVLPAHGFLRARGNGLSSNRTLSLIEDTLLFGRQPTKIEQWRMEQFGSFTNQRTGADLADADNDGVKNLMEYAFGLNPWDTTSADVPTWTHDGSKFETSFTLPAGVEGVAYGAEWSSTLAPFDWHDVTNQGNVNSHRYEVPQDATPLKFMRLKVTNTGSLPSP